MNTINDFKNQNKALVAGRAGYARMIEQQADRGWYLRERLVPGGWQVVNQTPLPVVCLCDPTLPFTADTEDAARHHGALVDQVAARGRTWITAARLRGRPVLRAGITSFLTVPADVDVLVEDLATVANVRS